MKKYLAELIGTMVLVLMGCGSAVIAGANGMTGVGILGISFAFGLSVLTMVYAIGSTSGCHINPAITFAMWLNKKISGKDALFYVIFQIIGAILGAAILFFIAKGNASYSIEQNGLGANFTSNYSLASAFFAEAIFTFIFLFVIFGATSQKSASTNNFAGIAIGLALVLIHIVCIPITGTSVNPARSIGPAIFVGGEAISQLWIFILAPLVGAGIAALVWRIFEAKDGDV
jgi:aquaporin Z